MAVTPAVTDEIPPILIGIPWIQGFQFYGESGALLDMTSSTAEIKIKSGATAGAATILTLTSGGGDITFTDGSDPATDNFVATIDDATSTGLAAARAYLYVTVTPSGGVEEGWASGPITIMYWGV